MSTFVEFIRAVQTSLLRLCTGSWRQLVIVAAAALVMPPLIHAASLEPTLMPEEPALEEPLLEEPILEETVLAVTEAEEPEPEDRFLSIPPMGKVPSAAMPEHGEQPAQGSALNASVCAPDGIAIDGFDLVSYYQADVPQRGLQTIFVEHLGLTYQFANAENRAAFVAEPSKYLPSYRGWCSTNLSMGRLACPDYTNYKLENGSLLFFEQVGFTNGRDVWNSDPLLHRRQANQNFALLSTQE